MKLLTAFWDFVDSLLPGLPFLLLALSIYSLYRGIKQSKGGSTRGKGAYLFAVILFGAAIAAWLLIRADYK